MDSFKNHFIKDETYQLKKIYFEMFLKIAQSMGLYDNKKIFLYKLFNSLKLTNIDQYFNSNTDDEKLVFDFVIKFKNSRFLDLILVDILILSNIDRNFSLENSKLIGILFSLFNITKKKAKKIIDMARYILTLDMGKKNYNLYPIILKNLENFVDVDNKFLISKYQVTQKEYKEIMGYNPSRFIAETKPVERVTWYDAVKYCNKKSLQDYFDPVYIIDEDSVIINLSKNGYRLPNADEWVYAAKGGKLTKGYKYSGSNCLGEVGWYDNNCDNRTHPVGMKKPNELGIYDMTGNVWEWCNDWDKNHPNSKILMGGSWYYKSVKYFKLSYTHRYKPNYSDSCCGFRIVQQF